MKRRRSLSQFETLAQQLVEGSFRRLFGDQLEPMEVAVRLARAMEDSLQGGQPADFYEVKLHPDDMALLLTKNPDLAEELAAYLARLAQQAGLALSWPQVTLTADPATRQRHVRVQVAHGQGPREQTTQVHALDVAQTEILAALRELDAFLIVAGRQHVPLDRPLLTLGRHIDNDIVLDSPLVSRFHAQIRWRYGRFILHDLSQRGRTAVNNSPVREVALQAGDVIALSDTLIVYGEGQETRETPSTNGDDDGQTLQWPGS